MNEHNFSTLSGLLKEIKDDVCQCALSHDYQIVYLRITTPISSNSTIHLDCRVSLKISVMNHLRRLLGKISYINYRPNDSMPIIIIDVIPAGRHKHRAITDGLSCATTLPLTYTGFGSAWFTWDVTDVYGLKERLQMIDFLWNFVIIIPKSHIAICNIIAAYMTDTTTTLQRTYFRNTFWRASTKYPADTQNLLFALVDWDIHLVHNHINSNRIMGTNSEKYVRGMKTLSKPISPSRHVTALTRRYYTRHLDDTGYILANRIEAIEYPVLLKSE